MVIAGIYRISHTYGIWVWPLTPSMGLPIQVSMAIQDHLSTSLARAVRHLGSQSAFAELVGRHQSTIHDWLRDGKLLPAEHVFTVEAATGIARHELRPDIYPIESSAPAVGTGGAPAVTRPAAGVPDALKGLQP